MSNGTTTVKCASVNGGRRTLLRVMFALRTTLARATARTAAAAPPVVARIFERGMHFRSKMGRGYSHRLAMMKNMVTSLIEHERIKTNLTKAKEVSRLADRMVTCAKAGDMSAHRKAARFVRTRQCMTKLFTILALRFKERQGGYTRVLKTYPRMGDHAAMAFVEFVDRPMRRAPWPLPEQPQSVMPGRGGRAWRMGKRRMLDERR